MRSPSAVKYGMEKLSGSRSLPHIQCTIQSAMYRRMRTWRQEGERHVSHSAELCNPSRSQIPGFSEHELGRLQLGRLQLGRASSAQLPPKERSCGQVRTPLPSAALQAASPKQHLQHKLGRGEFQGALGTQISSVLNSLCPWVSSSSSFLCHHQI